jgi:hypothetical protein
MVEHAREVACCRRLHGRACERGRLLLSGAVRERACLFPWECESSRSSPLLIAWLGMRERSLVVIDHVVGCAREVACCRGAPRERELACFLGHVDWVVGHAREVAFS